MDEVLGRLSEAARGGGFGVSVLSDGSVSVVSSDAGVVVVPDRAARSYRLEAPLDVHASDSGVVHESWSQVGPGPRAGAGAAVTRQWTRRVSLVYDPKVRQWCADPSGRIDEFVRAALEPGGWKRRWTRTGRLAAAAVIGGVVLLLAIWAGVTFALAAAFRSTVGAGWVWVISLALLGYGAFMFWWGQVRRR